MKKNIVDEIRRFVIHSDLINDNTLMECVLEDDDIVSVSIRHIEHNKIVEHTLARISLSQYAECFQPLFEINEKRDTIAIFKNVGKEFQLDRLYDLNNYSFISGEFLDLMYKRKFPNKKLTNELKKKM